MMATPSPSALDVRLSYASDNDPFLRRKFIRAVERASGQRRMEGLYRRHLNHLGATTDVCFFDAALKALKLDIQYDQASLDQVPTEGPVLFVANHPYGVLDGLALTWIAKKVRPDVKVMAHKALCQAPAAQDNLLPVDFDGGMGARQASARSRLSAIDWMQQGNAVGIFPGGGIATSLKPMRGYACELPWHPFTAKLIRSARPTVVPIYFSGQNSRLFQFASHLSPVLRLSLIFHETARRVGTRLDVKVGTPMPADEVLAAGDKTDIMMLLRRSTLALASEAEREAGLDPEKTFFLS